MFDSCDSMDFSPQGSSVLGIFQARILERVSISFSRESSRPGIEPGSPARQSDSLLTEVPGHSILCIVMYIFQCYFLNLSQPVLPTLCPNSVLCVVDGKWDFSV